MTDTWIIQEVEKNIAQSNRVVILDPIGEYSYLLPYIEKNTILLVER
jgi:hypothetical protein